jgi:hypothetical protein
MSDEEILVLVAATGAVVTSLTDGTEVAVIRKNRLVSLLRGLLGGGASPGPSYPNEPVEQEKPLGYISYSAIAVLKAGNRAIIYSEPTVTAKHAVVLMEHTEHKEPKRENKC